MDGLPLFTYWMTISCKHGFHIGPIFIHSHLFTHSLIYLHLFTHSYIYLHLFTHSYIYLHLFTHSYFREIFFIVGLGQKYYFFVNQSHIDIRQTFSSKTLRQYLIFMKRGSADLLRPCCWKISRWRCGSGNFCFMSWI